MLQGQHTSNGLHYEGALGRLIGWILAWLILPDGVKWRLSTTHYFQDHMEPSRLKHISGNWPRQLTKSQFMHSLSSSGQTAQLSLGWNTELPHTGSPTVSCPGVLHGVNIANLSTSTSRLLIVVVKTFFTLKAESQSTHLKTPDEQRFQEAISDTKVYWNTLKTGSPAYSVENYKALCWMLFYKKITCIIFALKTVAPHTFSIYSTVLLHLLFIFILFVICFLSHQ